MNPNKVATVWTSLRFSAIAVLSSENLTFNLEAPVQDVPAMSTWALGTGHCLLCLEHFRSVAEDMCVTSLNRHTDSFLPKTVSMRN